MIISHPDRAARVLEWDRIGDFPAAQKAVQAYRDDPSLETRVAAETSLDCLGPVARTVLGHWIVRAIPKPWRKKERHDQPQT